MELLESLCKAHGVSGFENDVSGMMRKELEKTCDSVEADGFGNVIGTKGRGKKKIMLAAHMDEIGLMVKYIDDKGFLSFVKVGGIDDRVLPNQRVVIKTKKGDVKGLIGMKPPHLQKEEERKTVIKYEDMAIDIGAKDRKEAEKMVEVGDPAIFEPNFSVMTKNVYYGKAVDNRLGCYILLKVMEKLPKMDATVYAVATAQEEVGLKGARVSSFKLDPDYAFAIDTTIAGDTPQVKKTESNLCIGSGPAILITEAGGRGTITNPRLRKMLMDTAKKNKIPYQLDVIEGGMTDGAMIYMNREGVPTGVVLVPCRYIHGATGVFDMRDVDNAVKLILKTLPGVGRGI